MLQHDDFLQSPAVAKRASWAIGFLGQPTATLLHKTLVPALAWHSSQEPSVLSVLADIAWAVGDVLAAAPTTPGRSEAIEALSEIAGNAVTSLTNATKEGGRRYPPKFDGAYLILAQAATRAIAIQADPASGDLLSTIADAASHYKASERGNGVQGPNPRDREECIRLFRFAEWGLQLLDQPSLLAHSSW